MRGINFGFERASASSLTSEFDQQGAVRSAYLRQTQVPMNTTILFSYAIAQGRRAALVDRGLTHSGC